MTVAMCWCGLMLCMARLRVMAGERAALHHRTGAGWCQWGEYPGTEANLKRWHQVWLGNVYAWAGRARLVNLGKRGFQFATACLLPGLLAAGDAGFSAPA
jgi:hypothetical protein